MEIVADVIPTREVVAEFFFCRPRQQWRMESVADVVPIREVVAEVVADVVPTREVVAEVVVGLGNNGE